MLVIMSYIMYFGVSSMYASLCVICYLFRALVQCGGKPDPDYVIMLCMCRGKPDARVSPMPDAFGCRGEPDARQESDVGIHPDAVGSSPRVMLFVLCALYGIW